MSFNVTYFFMSYLDPVLLFVTAVGTFAGIYIGAIPGLSVTMAVSILISFTYSWHVNTALALMVGVYVGGVYGGSRSAILLNIPGAPAAVATALDGYPLAQLGEAGRAIGLSTTESVVGGLLGVVALAVAAPQLSEMALKFAPRDYLLVSIMGILLVGSLSAGSLAKGIFSGALGIILGLVGMDPITAEGRFTFGSVAMLNGIHFVVIMIGLFGVSEALFQLKNLNVDSVKQKVDKILPSWHLVWKFFPLSLRSAIIGIIIGALPGTGGDIAALMAYDQARRTVKKPTRPFGQGAVEGIIAPETANNAAIGGAYIPMLTLGIPGDAVTAVIIGALYIHGLKPGPMLMIETPHLFWFTVGNLLLANVFLLIFGLTGIRLFAKVVEVHKGILFPIIILLSTIGTYAIQNSISDVYWMLGFGIFGYFLKTYDFSVGSVILGAILGPLMDVSYRRSVMSEGGSLVGFAKSLVSTPISLFLTVAIVLMIFSQTPLWKKITQRLARSRSSNQE